MTLYRWIIPVAVQAIVPVIIVFGAFLIRMASSLWQYSTMEILIYL
jgi:hypothetical protein